MIIAVEKSLAQHLHINSQVIAPAQLLDNDVWAVRVAGDFMIIVNDMLGLPVIVRHPQRFNDSRSFMTAFKREFLKLLEVAPIPHAKIRMLREAQFQQVQFTLQIQPEMQQRLQLYQNMIMGPNAVIDWEQEPQNEELALKIADQTPAIGDRTSDNYSVMEAAEDYVTAHFALAAHPALNEHNRTYLYRSLSLNDIMNASAVSEKILDDYEEYLEYLQKSEKIIERDLDCAVDYIGYCETLGMSVLDDLTLVYHYFINYEKRHDRQPSETYFKQMGYAFREFARFLRAVDLFNSDDFDIFVQAINQGLQELHSHHRIYRFQRVIKQMQEQMQAQRQQAAKYNHRKYTVYAELNDYRPRVWRRFTVSGATRLDSLCFMTLAAFNASGSHLFDLQHNDNHYQLPLYNSGISQTKDMTNYWLGDCQPATELLLTYDFGDMWQFNIKVEAVTEKRMPNRNLPQMMGGVGLGIVEDIGGVAGLAQTAKDDPKINTSFDTSSFQKRWNRQTARIRDCYE